MARAVLVGVGLLLALLFVPLPRALNTPVFRQAFDLGHAPLFAVLFLAAFWLLKPRVRRAGLVAALVSAAAGGLTELVQLATSREASVGDLALDVVGIALAWTGVRSWRGARYARHIESPWRMRGGVQRRPQAVDAASWPA
jgi:hypothetical protein